MKFYFFKFKLIKLCIVFIHKLLQNALWMTMQSDCSVHYLLISGMGWVTPLHYHCNYKTVKDNSTNKWKDNDNEVQTEVQRTTGLPTNKSKLMETMHFMTLMITITIVAGSSRAGGTLPLHCTSVCQRPALITV